LLSNIAAGSPNQISTLTHTKGLPQMIVAQLKAGEWDVKKEAAWVISNILTGGTRSHVQQIVEMGAMKPLCELLGSDDSRVIEVALDALEAVGTGSCADAVRSAITGPLHALCRGPGAGAQDRG
jgi:HEAT repeat protein